MTSTTSMPLPEQHPTHRFKQRMLRTNACDVLPVTLRHERIYILPTKRGLAFIAVVMVMLLASMNYGLNLGYALSFMMVGLFASCLLSTYQNLARLELQSIAATDTFAGKQAHFVVTFAENRKRTRHSISLTVEGASDRIDVKANSSKSGTLRLQDCSRGLMKPGRLTISSDFPLGLWRGWGYIHPPVSTYVYPRAESPTAEFNNHSATTSDKTTKQFGEQEYKQLKRYQKTDSLGSVAWKQVAKGGDWYSKDFEPESTSNNTVIRWQDTPANFTLEQRLSRMCAWVVAAQADNISFGFELPGITLKSQSGPEHVKHCLRLLSTYSLPEANPVKNR